MENPIKMDDLGVPLFLETPTCLHFSKIQVIDPYWSHFPLWDIPPFCKTTELTPGVEGWVINCTGMMSFSESYLDPQKTEKITKRLIDVFAMFIHWFHIWDYLFN